MEVEFRKCKICKIKFRGYKQNGIWVSRFCPYCRSIKKLDKKAKTKTTKRYQRKEIKTLSAKAWRLFAQTIKKEAMNFQEYIECYTCYKMFKIGHINAGHFKHRRGLKYTAIDFEPKHIKCQCIYCNKGGDGMAYEFGKRLEEDYGESWVKEIIRRRETDLPLTKEELLSIINQYER